MMIWEFKEQRGQIRGMPLNFLNSPLGNFLPVPMKIV